MGMNALSSFSIFPATTEQSFELRRRAAVEWVRGLTVDESLNRDYLADKLEAAQISSTPFNRRFRREGLVRSQSDAKPKTVTCYGVASVFTPARFRGKGYAAHMMRLLHWVLADASLLPAEFPNEWGAPPARVMNAGDGLFSALWSDVGPEFYKRCGPTKDIEGWVVRAPFSTIWDITDLDNGLSSEDWTMLDEDRASKLWADDAHNIAHTLLPAENYQISFAFLPHKGVAQFHPSRSQEILAKDVSPPIQHCGMILDSDTFVTWTFETRSHPKTLLITRLSCPPLHFEEMLSRVMFIAKSHGMEKIEVYNLPDTLQPLATRRGGITSEREEHLAAFKWYGAEDSSVVAWLFNERWLLYGFLIPVGLFLFSFFLRVPRSEDEIKKVEYHVQHRDDGATYTALNLSASTVPAFSLTAILPFTQFSLPNLEEALKSLLGPSQLREIILLCPHANTLQARTAIRQIVSSYSDFPDIRLQTFPKGSNAQNRTLYAASQVSGWVLVLDQNALVGENSHSRHILLNPPALSFPYGPKGVCFALFDSFEPCIRRLIGFPQEAHHLLPPFIIPAALVKGNKMLSLMADPWRTLGEHVAATRNDGIGGVVFGTTSDISSQVKRPQGQAYFEPVEVRSGLFDNGKVGNDILASKSLHIGVFAIILPTIEDLGQLSPLLCVLQNHHEHILNIWVDSNAQDGRFVVSEHCTLFYARASLSSSEFHAQQLCSWFRAVAFHVDVVISIYEDSGLIGRLDLTTILRHGSVLVRLSRRDIAQTEWMSSLSVTEWKNWNQPRVDISIITNNRPQSLVRLMTSLSNAYFFGDKVDLRINVEQSADEETLTIVRDLPWLHGTVFVHHRIVQGGLMPAVVESWYPRSNDTYGLLLEDDIELSPMFYAWAKMALLRYRYGHADNKSPSMFGISLYQQKNVELPPEGRRLFNARTLFSSHGHPNPTTPYLSPIPCSWGAIYFPEHWREFHAYLPLRLSSQFPPMTTSHSRLPPRTIVPNVRSNNWTKSWKKYFIELVYLRGYVMLYPNYPDFVSLSTNHLEVGSHVKIRTQEKQKQFIVPLMETTNCNTIGLLDLPGRTLPNWNMLPVLNLTGEMATMESLAETGRVRREELTECTNSPAPFDIQRLLCIEPLFNGPSLER
ncbi:hypothetical protein H0H87_012581 [Tephrocybe sp. NHM501043]|nr:hypothetical protein H0H87_012581 [Tephrocybe sp. NHM501043]